MIIRLASSVALAAAVTGMLAAMPIQGVPAVSGGSRTIASTNETTTTSASDTGAEVNPGNGSNGGGNPSLQPRVPFRKIDSNSIQLPVDPISGQPRWNGRLAVKFRDDLRFRAEITPAPGVRTAQGGTSLAVADTLRKFGGSIRQLLRNSPEQLAALEARAAAKSGIAQPDLAGMMYVDVTPDQLLDAARAFNDLPEVEWVNIEQDAIPDGGNNNASQAGCGQNGPADGTGANNCYTAAPQGRCSTLGGGQGCNDPGGCNADTIPPSCAYGCNNTVCCDTVGTLLPGCNDLDQAQGWDALCATYANMLCQSTVYDTLPVVAGDTTGSFPSTPGSYKYDPCFAMRGPVDISTDVVVQGGVETIAPAPILASQLLTYSLDSNGALVPGSLTPVTYPGGTIQDEANAGSGVPQQAMPDPSLEGAYLALSAGCFAEHTFGGCNQVSCCVYVCRTDPSCCVVEWDATCVALAQTASGSATSPCTTQEMDGTAFPPSGPTPLLTAGREDLGGGNFGNARGYQNYTLGRAVLAPFDVLPPGEVYPVQPPDVNVATVPDPGRSNPRSNLGTLAVINSGYRGGGFDLEGYDTLVSQLGINPTTKAHGQTVKVGVIEHAAYVNHEDLVNKVIPEPNQTQVLIISSPLDPNHGTAVLGIIGAENNNFGVTGIADGAQLYFFPIVSREEGSRLPQATANAIIEFSEGDVINMSIGFGGGATIPSDPTMFTLISLGTQAGITFVISAGNSASPVQAAPEGQEGDSGAIIVGACWPGFQVGQLSDAVSVPGPLPGFNYCRLNFSNFTDLDNATASGVVHVAAWGTGVTSTGYGELFHGTNTSTDPLQVNRLRSYTAAFNGTSAAAPLISGFTARLQSFAKAYFGVPVPPTQLRANYQVPANRFQQCGISYASPAFPGYPDNGSPAAGDILPGGEQARIGGFPRARECVSGIVAGSFGGSPTTYSVVTGTYQSGTDYSIRVIDNNPLRVASTPKRAGNTGQGYGPALRYPLTGGTTDVQVRLVTPQASGNISFINIATSTAVSVGVPCAEIVYAWNRKQQRWKTLGFYYPTTAYPNPPQTFAVQGDARDYVVNEGGSSVIYARVYTCGLTSGAYQALHDLLAITVNIDIFDPGGGAGGGGNAGG